MQTVHARREAGSFIQSDVQSEQVSTMPPACLAVASIPIAELDFSDRDTLPGFPLDEHEQACSPHDLAVGPAGHTMVADDGTHPDSRIPFTTGPSAGQIFDELADLDPRGWVS